MIELVLIGGIAHGEVLQCTRDHPPQYADALRDWPLLAHEPFLRLLQREPSMVSYQRYTYLDIHGENTYYYGVV